MKKTMMVGVMTLALAMSTMAGAVASDDDIVVVTGDTVDTTVSHESELAPDDTGWWFGRDPNNTTSFEFTEDGILVNVGDAEHEKFIAEHFLFQRVSEVGEISFNYTSNEADSQFYINVYVNHEEEPSGDWYDCRYDYTVVTASDEDIKSVDTSGDAANVASRNDTDCPASLAASPEDSFVRAYSINVGDTSASALEPATIISSTAGDVTYVFQAEEQMAVDISDCKDGGYEAFEFRNQGQCIASIKANENANK